MVALAWALSTPYGPHLAYKAFGTKLQARWPLIASTHPCLKPNTLQHAACKLTARDLCGGLHQAAILINPQQSLQMSADCPFCCGQGPDAPLRSLDLPVAVPRQGSGGKRVTITELPRYGECKYS